VKRTRVRIVGQRLPNPSTRSGQQSGDKPRGKEKENQKLGEIVNRGDGRRRQPKEKREGGVTFSSKGNWDTLTGTPGRTQRPALHVNPANTRKEKLKNYMTSLKSGKKKEPTSRARPRISTD